MPAARVLFVSHTGQMAGAELILLDVVKPWAGAAAFLFEDGPLHQALAKQGLSVAVSRWGRGLTNVHRDGSLLKAIPLVGRMGAIILDIARQAHVSDVVYANSQKAFVLSAIATTIVRRPLIWHLHDIINAAHFGRAQRRLQVGLANLRASKVIVPSQAAADAFVAEGGRPDLVEVVANGLDMPPDMRSPTELRSLLGLPRGPLAGVFSRLAAWKGQHVMLQALAHVPDIHCIIAGDAMFGEHAYASRLRAIADELKIADRVHFLGYRNDVASLMRSVDVMVHPSVDPEPFGRTLVEAMLSGVPVIATNAGAAPDILDGGKAGALIPPGDPDALAAALRVILLRPEGLATQLDYARARAREYYGMDRMLTSISDAIGRVAGGAAA